MPLGTTGFGISSDKYIQGFISGTNSSGIVKQSASMRVAWTIMALDEQGWMSCIWMRYPRPAVRPHMRAQLEHSQWFTLLYLPGTFNPMVQGADVFAHFSDTVPFVEDPRTPVDSVLHGRDSPGYGVQTRCHYPQGNGCEPFVRVRMSLP